MVKHGQELTAHKDKHNIWSLSNKEAMELQKKEALGTKYQNWIWERKHSFF
ncbi:unnamed protein product [Meloidogyne enterolobii]|uniref:Uncharacterized protein n=1 Tax=Meloidogyne enterolobii TaxID=390850 RepID=A0ACB0YZC5_MELEN